MKTVMVDSGLGGDRTVCVLVEDGCLVVKIGRNEGPGWGEFRSSESYAFNATDLQLIQAMIAKVVSNE